MDIDIIYNESCIEVLKRLGDNSIDAIVTDPPYGLEFMGKEWDRFRGKFSKGEFKGFVLPSQITRNIKCPDCGKWIYDHPPRNCLCGGVRREQMRHYEEFCYQWASECLRVIKPGGNLLSFGGTRTYHRMVCAIEDTGFEIRDCIMWVYGSGFPKSLNIGKAIQKQQGIELDDTGIVSPISRPNVTEDLYKSGKVGKNFTYKNVTTPEAKLWEGYGTGLKPAYEPIVLAMAPLDGTFAENCLKWGVGGLNIDGCRIPTEEGLKGGQYSGKERIDASCYGKHRNLNPEHYQQPQGRFPANFILDGSQEVMELFPKTKSGAMSGVYRNTIMKGKPGERNGKEVYLEQKASEGSAARFFYCAKASKKERNAGCEDLEKRLANKSGKGLGRECSLKKRENENGDDLIRLKNNHPTVKPLALMEYLIKLVTRPGHIVLDPFIGSGTTAMACVKLGRHYIGCELDKGYYDIAIKRIEYLTNNKVYGRIRYQEFIRGKDERTAL